MTTTNPTARTNRQARVLFVGDDGTTHADRVFGGGFGAFVKMVDRATTALTGWKPADVRVTFDQPTHRVTMTHRTTGEARGFTTLEA